LTKQGQGSTPQVKYDVPLSALQILGNDVEKRVSPSDGLYLTDCDESLPGLDEWMKNCGSDDGSEILCLKD
jgi:hypothetical protein